jgi:subtilisin family serine protease
VRVLNLSLWQIAGQSNMTDVSAALQTCEDNGILPVLIAGNGSNNDGVGTSDPSANPLAAGNPETLRVAGVGSNNQIYPQSDYGSALADIAAPFCVPVDSPDGSWGVGCGTSFAAPQVAAVAAEVFNLDPSLTPAEVKQLLMSSGTPVSGLPVTSGSILDYYNALVAAGYVPPPPAGNASVRNG